MLATLAQSIGYTILTWMSLNEYAEKMGSQRITTVEVNMNVGLIVSSFIYYYAETHFRKVVFANWQTEKVN